MDYASNNQYTTMIRDLPQGERPRERLKAYGPSYLNNAELIAILLRTGVSGEGVVSVSARLLSRYKGLDGLARISFSELCAERGISEAKACQIMAALELGKRLASLKPEDKPIIASPQDVSNLLNAEMAFLDQEHVKVVLMDVKNQVMGISQVYIGSVNTSLLRSSEVFRPAVRQNSPAVIVVHNHPSGDPTPSAQDIETTRALAEAATLLDIELLDHIIIGSGGRYLSLKEQGLGFPRK